MESGNDFNRRGAVGIAGVDLLDEVERDGARRERRRRRGKEEGAGDRVGEEDVVGGGSGGERAGREGIDDVGCNVRISLGSGDVGAAC